MLAEGIAWNSRRILILNGKMAVAPGRVRSGSLAALRKERSRLGQEVSDRVGIVAQHVVLGIARSVETVRFLHQVPQYQYPQPHGGRIVVV